MSAWAITRSQPAVAPDCELVALASAGAFMVVRAPSHYRMTLRFAASRGLDGRGWRLPDGRRELCKNRFGGALATGDTVRDPHAAQVRAGQREPRDRGAPPFDLRNPREMAD